MLADRPARPGRQPSIDLQTAQMLEKRLAERPDKATLLDKNILKGEDPS